MSTDRDDPMQVANSQPAGSCAGHAFHPPWPFPAAPFERPSHDVIAYAREVIATTARAFLVHLSS